MEAEVIFVTIHENLRQLRHNCGMTQEQVAERIGITRQALSSYETGRTHPDVDMLIQLAEIYRTNLECILYGQERKLKAAHRIRLTALILFGALTLLTLISSAFLFIANRFFPVAVGHVPQESMDVLEGHIWFNKAWQITDSVILALSFLGSAILLILRAADRVKLPLKTKLWYVAFLSVSLLIIGFVFSVADPRFGFLQYATTPIGVAMRLALFFFADLSIERILRQKTVS